MAEKVKVRVKAGRSIAVDGKFVSGETEVPADKVEALVKKKLIEAPASGQAQGGAAGEADSADASDDASNAQEKPKRGRKSA